MDHREQFAYHRGHPEEHDDEHADACNTANSADGCGACNSQDSVDNEKEVRLENRRETSSNEATDGEGDERIRQHLGALGIGNTTVLMGVVDEQGSAGDLGTDIAELSDETEDHVVLLVERTRADDLTIGIDCELDSRVISDGAASLDAGGFGDFGELGEEEQDTNCSSEACDSEVYILHCSQVLGVCP